LYFESGLFAQAAPLIEAAVAGAQWPGEAAPLTLMLAKAFIGLNDYSRSDSICWQLIHNSPAAAEALEASQLVRDMDTPEKKLAVAKVFFQHKKQKEALALSDELLKDAVAAGRLLPDILFHRAQVLALEGKSDAAADFYRRLAAEYPEHLLAPSALYSLAEYHRSKGKSDDALLDYARVAERYPAHALAPQALRQRSKIFEAAGDPREHAEYEAILQNYPSSSTAVFAAMNWGVDLHRRQDYRSAQTIFERLLSLNESAEANAEALFWIAKSSLAGGDIDSAKSKLKELILKFDDSYHAFRARAILLALDQGAQVYSRPYSAPWHTLFAFDSDSFQPFDFTLVEKTVEMVSQSMPGPEQQRSLQRLHFLLTSQFPEAKVELEFLLGVLQGDDARYALALALYHAQAYHDSLRIATSLHGRLADAERAENIRYLLYPAAYPDLLGASAFKYEVDPLLALAVMREESHFRETTVSPSDACGLMQILPRTGKWLAQDKLEAPAFDRSDLFLPSVNIELGSYYLRYLLNQFENNPMLAVAAYNWGETNLRKWMQEAPKEDFDVFVESIPADQTRRYVKKVFRSHVIYRSLYPSDWFSAYRKL
jgi:TolA-binding protein